MYRIINLKQHINRFSYFGNYLNSMQIVNLPKYDNYPSYNNFIMRKECTNIIVHRGKLIINLFNINNNKKKILYAEHDKLFNTDADNDLLLTNKKYLLTIAPVIFYSLNSYEDSVIQILFKSSHIINHYNIYKKKINVTKTEYL